MTGETCAAAVRRIRLHRAACWLVQTDLSVARIAADVGMENVQSFTRIFRQGYGVTPGAFRKRGELRPPLLRPEKGDIPVYDVEITEHPNRRLAALPHLGAYLEVGKVFEKVSMLFTTRNLWPHATGMVGVYYDDPDAVAEKDLRSHAGVVVNDSFAFEEPFEEVSLAPGKYATLHFKGPYAGLKAAYMYLYGEWLPKSGQEALDQPPAEIYLNSPNEVAPEELLTDIIVPLK
jgi:AraC family transcriptional regulator